MTFFILFLFGLFFGSFFNVVIDRLPREESILKGRSHCEYCKKTLVWNDLIPLVSYLTLKGRCRYCHKKLSIYYPFMELLTGILFGATYLTIGQTNLYSLVYMLFVISALEILFFIDLKYGLIPFAVVFPGVIISVLFLLLTSPLSFVSSLLSGLGAGGFFLAIFLFTKGKGMGFGDVVYAFWMGLLLGFPKIIMGLYIAFVLGAVISVLLVLMHRKKLKGGTVPFGPFLVFGTLIMLFWGDRFMQVVFRYILHR